MPSIREFKDIDSLEPHDFELFVRDLFGAAGWTDLEVTVPGVTYRHGDGHLDIRGRRGDRLYAFQVKHRQAGAHGSPVGVDALTQVVTGAKLSGDDCMIVVTNSLFTSEARIRALRLGVELVDRDALQNLWVTRDSEIGHEIQLHDFQQAVLDDVLQKFESGKSRFLVEMATGLGKTYTAAKVIQAVLARNPGKRCRVLVAAHQIEILIQSVTAFKNVLGIGNYTYSACFDGAPPEDTDFVFATFDTLFSRIQEFESEAFDVVLIDEAHHTPAITYGRVVDHFKPTLLIGLTATPYRTDRQSVLRYFGGAEGHVGKYDLVWGLKNKKLAFPRYRVFSDDLRPEQIRSLELGVSLKDLDRCLFLERRDEEIVARIEETIKKNTIEHPKVIVFCRSIEHVTHFLPFFEPGSATSVHSKMNDDQRRNNIRDFREGGYKFILVCNLFNEGIDIPETNVLVFLRYTGSRIVWLQQLGRGLRKTKNKDFVFVLDFVGSLERVYEVQDLVRAVRGPPTSGGGPPEIVIDDKIEVEYSESAAAVFPLLERLELRLRSRTQVADALEEFFESFGRFPEFERLDTELPTVSPDQIATHFGSYLSFIRDVLGERADDVAARAMAEANRRDLCKRLGVEPTARAVSLASMRGGLMACSEREVEELLGIEAAKDAAGPTEGGALEVSGGLSPAPDSESQTPGPFRAEAQGPDGDSWRDLLVREYGGSLRTIEDFDRLPEEAKGMVKAEFLSVFAFLQAARDAQKLAEGTPDAVK